ncbi:hypothetical protein [Halarchaeum acidiphilum]|uniref:hypothetical protein n=1 Tax=Halarchaeum acidiphilum TaxID=489138 RepID=UPI0011D1F91E|nr:hypothetical protein [Halarchaeum acidiphilum]
MASSAWFFSTIAQTVAALTGFIISIIALVRQFEEREKRSRTDELRSTLREFQGKYKDEIYEVMKKVEAPFSTSPPPQVDNLEDSDITDICREEEYTFGDNAYSNRVWCLCHKLTNILDDISASEKPEQHYLLSSQQIEELEQCSAYLSSHVVDGDEFKNEIEQAKGEPISQSDNVFNSENQYADLQSWFQSNFQNSDREAELDGNDLASLRSFFNELDRDVHKISIQSENTVINEKSITDDLITPLSLLVLSGIVLPIMSLWTFPDKLSFVTANSLLLYQAILVLASFSIFSYISWILVSEI